MFFINFYISIIYLPSCDNGLGSDSGKFSDNIVWTFSLSILEALFNVVFTLKLNYYIKN